MWVGGDDGRCGNEKGVLFHEFRELQYPLMALSYPRTLDSTTGFSVSSCYEKEKSWGIACKALEDKT
jgi:hypothetical protein